LAIAAAGYSANRRDVGRVASVDGRESVMDIKYATVGQVTFINSLDKQLGYELDRDFLSMTSSEASALIRELKNELEG
jgi:hypothetical protein